MSGRSWLGRPAVIAAAITMGLFLITPAAYSRRKATPTPTPTPMPTPAPTPEAKIWNFDSDKAHQVAQGWQALAGDWEVQGDATAPSPPNTYGLPPGRLMRSLLSGLEYYPMTILNDPTEYSDFTLETAFKAKKGYFDCSAGLIFRYAGPKDYYVLGAGCPSDYFALYRVKGGQATTLRQTVNPIDEGVWYQLKVTAKGDRFTCYLNNKVVFDVSDSKISKGRIGLWARDDSQVRYDNVTLTLPLPTDAVPGAEVSPGAEMPPVMPGAPGEGGPGGGAPPPLPPLPR